MSNGIQISPLPSQTSIATVREIFKSFTLDKIILKNNKAYIKFVNPDDVDGLQMKYHNNIIPQLSNAKIIEIPQDFSWGILDTQQNIKRQKDMKDMKTTDFILQQSSQYNNPNIIYQNQNQIKSKFIVITDCQPKIVTYITQQQIRKKIFPKLKIGRIIKYKQNIYIQFLDQNQIQTLEVLFPGLRVKDLGFKATLSPVDQNFSYQLVKKQVQKYQRYIVEEEKQKIERLERKKKQQAEIQQVRKQQQRRLEQQSQFANWNVRPEGERELIPNREGKSIRPEVFWAIIVGLWGFYVMFM